MPELPEVETIVRGLREPLIGRTIMNIWTDWERIIATPSTDEFGARVVGQTVQSLGRRGKYILIYLNYDILIVHLKMTGRLYVADNDSQYEADRWVHFRTQLDANKQLRFSDSRKFGRVYLTTDINNVIGKMGPEPLEDTFTLTMFRDCLNGRNKLIKALLLDQSFIAGVGNIYADEALHRARIHPLRRSHTLTEPEIEKLYEEVRATLQAGVDYEGASINWYRKPDGTQGESQKHFYVYNRKGETCLNCGYPIEKIWVAQRGTHFCPNCQII